MTTPDDRFALVRVPPPGSPHRSILNDAIMVGSCRALLEQLPDTAARTDALLNMYRIADSAVEAEQRRDNALQETTRLQDEARDTQIRQIADAVNRLSARIDAMEKLQARQLAADKASRIRDALEDLHGHNPDGGLSPVPESAIPWLDQIAALDGHDLVWFAWHLRPIASGPSRSRTTERQAFRQYERL